MMAASLQARDAYGPSAIQDYDLPELLVTNGDPAERPNLLGRESPQKDVAPPSPSKEPILLKSNLQKKGKRFKGWHQRYFEIQGKHMYYYKNHTKADCLGEIDLSLCVSCAVTSEATFGVPFEICTTLRTHVMSARSTAERDQWIQIINAQMGRTEESSVVSRVKPKRWKTFKNAFKLPQRQRAQNSSGTKPRKSIMNRLKRRRQNAPAPLKIAKDSTSEEPQHHNRPLSLNENEIPKDALEALLDVMPSRSLPATPLTKKRSDHLNLSTPESPIFDDPPSPLPPSTPPTIEVTAPVIEINYSPPIESTNATMENGSEDHTTSSNGAALPPKESDVSNEVQHILERAYTWDKVREILQEASNNQRALDDNMSYDVLPKQDDQEWQQYSSGIEQLRAFLAVCD